MKKEAVNIFNQGLNKDLNTIVTPNNVLTDNLNGTFLTYNGDELSLQNDAGNTRIPVADTGDQVKLSEGFYPLGMKEYGGVLYIVSGKKGLDEDGLLKPELDEIEFGSYPSPELASYTTFHGQLPISLINDNDIFYKSFIINTDYFKTGRCISFRYTGDIDISNVWTKWDHKGLYYIKLLLQLDNGTIDLTDDVWESFSAYKDENPSDTSLHWLLSQDFSYYCPYSYKGRLAIEVIFNEPIFEPIKYYDAEIGNGIYNFKIDIKVGKTDAMDALEIIGYNIEIITDKESFIGDTVEDKITSVKTYKPPTYTIPSSNIISISENVSSNNKLMHYTITPIFKYINTGEILDWESLPNEFKAKYTIKSYMLLSEKYNNVGFHIEESECIPQEGKRSVKVLSLIGENGYLNTDLESELLNGKPYIFYEDGGYTPKGDYNKLGTFKVANGLPVDIRPLENIFSDSNIENVITTKLKNTPVSISDPYCGEVTIVISFSAPLDMDSPTKIKNGTLSIYQSSSTSMLTYESYNGRDFIVKVNAAENIEISFSHDKFSWVRKTILKENITSNTPYNIALIVGFNTYFTSKLNTTPITEFTFSTPWLELGMNELCLYIHDMFSTTIPESSRVQIIPQDSTASYTIEDSMLYYTKGTDSEILYAVVKDNNYTLHSYKQYPYRIINATQVLKDEYINIDNLPNQNYTNFIKLGSSSLGYLIFPYESSFMVAYIDPDSIANVKVIA